MAVVSKAGRNWMLWLLADILFFAVFAFLAWRYFPSQRELTDRLNDSLKLLHGQLPYVDFAAEYPPLAYLFYLPPALFFRSPVSYYIAYVAELLFFDLLFVWLIVRISTRLGISVTRSLAIHAILLIAVGPIVVASYDIFPAVLTLVALYFFIEGRNNLAWAFTSLGFMTKLFPVVLVPLFILYLWRRKKYRQIFYGAGIFFGIALALSLPWFIVNARAYAIVATYELDRPLHSESVYGSILLIGRILGLDKVVGIYNFGSWNLTSFSADSLASLSFYITAVLLFCVYVRYWRLTREKENTGDALTLLQMSAAVILVLILSSKVLSMQYLVWLVPLLPFIRGRWQLPACGSFIVAGFLGQSIYPYNYNLFENFSPPVIILMLVRNVLLIFCAILLLLPGSRKLVSDS